MMYYKIVTKNLKSYLTVHEWDHEQFFADPFNKTWSVQYKINEFVYPRIKNSKLFVFDNIFDAQNFGLGLLNNGYELYECNIKNPQKAKMTYWNCIEDFAILWDHLRWKKKYKDLINFDIPKGTVMCDAVKLLKKIS